MKKCRHCHRYKTLDLFTKDMSNQDEHDIYCHICKRLKSRRHYYQYLEDERERVRNYYQTDVGREKNRRAAARFRAKYPELVKEKKRAAYNLKHPDLVVEYGTN